MTLTKRSKLVFIILGALCVLQAITIIVLALMKIYPQKVGFSVVGVYKKASPGYGWVNDQLVWLPGKRHDHCPHIYAGENENSWQADYGYAFENKKSLEVKWVPDVFSDSALGTLKTGKEIDSFEVKKSCDTCNGAGGSKVECSSCRGKIRVIKRTECQNCNAAGTKECTNCDGSGQQPCTFQVNCDGTCRDCINGVYRLGNMQQRCFSCGGTGRHHLCKGTGKIFCFQCGGKKKITCFICRGNGATESWVVCNECSGRGIKVLKCSKCSGNGHHWEKVSKVLIQQLQLEGCDKLMMSKIAEFKNSMPKKMQTQAGNNSNKELQRLQKQLIQQQLLQMQLSLLNDSFNTPAPSFESPSPSFGKTSISTRRRCSTHGTEYDIRYGGCAWCRQPDFGSGKTTNARCIRHSVYYDPSIGCPMCR